MSEAVVRLCEHRDILSNELLERPLEEHAPPQWGLSELLGRLSELSGQAALTLAFGAVLDAQRQREPVAWVSSGPDLFYPPDVAAGGVDLEALAVIRARGVREAAHSADKLLRSGAFGLVVLDLEEGQGRERRDRGAQSSIPTPLLARLVKLTQKHEAAVLCLTDGPGLHRPSSLGSLVSLRCEAHRRREDAGQFHCDLRVLKDKKRGPGWRWSEVFEGPAGLL